MDPLASKDDLDAARRQIAAAAADDELQGRLADAIVSSSGNVSAPATRGPLRIVRYYEAARLGRCSVFLHLTRPRGARGRQMQENAASGPAAR